jgi:hypothetical protein
MSIQFDESGVAHADLRIDLQAARPDKGVALYGLLLPFSLSPSAVLRHPEDAPAALVSNGSGYSMLAVAPAPNSDSVVLAVAAPTQLSATSTGKAKLQFDFGYSLMSQVERARMALPTVLLPATIRVILPKQYEAADVAISPSFRPIREGEIYQVDLGGAGPQAPVWISFPDPRRSATEWAKLVIALFVGAIALAQAKTHRELRQRSLLWWFIPACGLLIAAAYFAFILSSRLEFLVYTAAAIPTTAYYALLTGYLLVAKRRQARVLGQVRLNGAPVRLAQVQLEGHAADSTSAEWKQLAKARNLSEQGTFELYTWVPPSEITARVRATYKGKELVTEEFRLKREDDSEVVVDFKP